MSAPELKRSENGVWYIHWSEGRRSKRVSTRAKDLASAKAFLAQWLLMETSASPGATLTCEEIWETYAAEYLEAGRVLDKRRSETAWNNLKRHFAAYPPAAITQAVIDEYARKRTLGQIGARPAKLSTVWLELLKLRASWNWAVKRRPPLLTPADLPRYTIPEAPLPRDRWLRDGEIDRLLTAAAELRDNGRLSRAERFLWIALEMAARKRAIELLRWDQVDFETRVVHFLQPGARQTRKRKVSVPISDALLPVLRQAFDERRGPTVLDTTVPIYRELERVARRAGVEGLTPHVLRHTAATIMARNGVPLWLIAGVLGNSVEMVEKVYAKHCPQHLVSAVNLISTGRGRTAAQLERV